MAKILSRKNPGKLPGVRQLGYHRVAQWPIQNRDVITLSSGGMDMVSMMGEAWCLDDLK